MNQKEDLQKAWIFEICRDLTGTSKGAARVLAEKAKAMQERYGDRWIIIAPDFDDQAVAAQMFAEEEPLSQLDMPLAEQGLGLRCGRWLVPGKPRLFLVKDCGLNDQANYLLGRYWERYQVDSLSGNSAYVAALLFGHAAGVVVAQLVNRELLGEPTGIVCHWHGVQSAAGLLYLRTKAPEVISLFQVHEPVLSRGLFHLNPDQALLADKLKPVEQARMLHRTAPFSLEHAVMQQADGVIALSPAGQTTLEKFYGRKPEHLLPNAMGPDFPGDKHLQPAAKKAIRSQLCQLASNLLGREFDPDHTLMFLSAGDYEFTEKGLDLLLDAFNAFAGDMPQGSSQPVLLWLCHPGDHRGPLPQLINPHHGKTWQVPCPTTHIPADFDQDPICQALQQQGFDLSGNHRAIPIFVPATLDATDPLVPYTYRQVLSAMDLTLFPYAYEPWGYSVLESLAAGVPCVTTDASGIGQYMLSQGLSNFQWGRLLKRTEWGAAQTTEELCRFLREFVESYAAQHQNYRNGVQQCAAGLQWSASMDRQSDIYTQALIERKRRFMALNKSFKDIDQADSDQENGFQGLDHDTPTFRTFTVNNHLPAALEPLRELANNLWWSWNPKAEALFHRMDPASWSRVKHNPVQLLDAVPQERLVQLAKDKTFLNDLHQVMKNLEAYLEARRDAIQNPQIAYFCMEYGIASCLPIYSGGLGVLAGDHIKSASDLKVPLVAVGLAYRSGYFEQRIDTHGNQQVEPVKLDFGQLPMTLLRTADHHEYNFQIPLPGRSLYLRVWKVLVGATVLYLLDTDHPQNLAMDREITSSLYGGDLERRLQQEIVLGIAGRKLLQLLELEPQVYHMNEGHASFLILSRLYQLIRDHGLDYPTALEYCRKTSLFTTHTPVPAGHDTFPEDLMRPYFTLYRELLDRPWSDIMALGRVDAANRDERFSMTLLGLRGAEMVNGVSKIHGEVSRHNFNHVVPGYHLSEVPVGHITNGVHVRTWVSSQLQGVLDQSLGTAWGTSLESPTDFEPVRNLADQKLFEIKRGLKADLIDGVRESLQNSWRRRSDSPGVLAKVLANLDRDALIIGFARRFAPYKRATLLFRDLEALAKIMADETRPVLFLFAGKAHPADEMGKSLINEIYHIARKPEFLGRVILLENYGVSLAKKLVQGCDVWLNTPTRPLEASGTSGMKAAMNGALNLSVSDGWWAEGYNGKNGWVIGGDKVYDVQELQNELDSQNLYHLLQEEVIPTFFERGKGNFSPKWMSMFKEAMASCIPRFSAARMLRDYTSMFYNQGRESAENLRAKDYSAVRKLSGFKKELVLKWPGVHIEKVQVASLEKEAVLTGEDVDIQVLADLGGLESSQVVVQFVTGRRDKLGDIKQLHVIPLEYDGEEQNMTRWKGIYQPRSSGSQGYGIRILPRFPGGSSHAMDLGLVKWA